MFKVEISGFNTLKEAQTFCDWYSGAGEQDASYWFEARQAEGEIEVSFMGTNGPITTIEDTVYMKIKPE